MNVIIPLLGLLILFVIGEICGFILKIRSNKFYSAFHLAAGFLAFFLFYNLFENYIVSIFAVIVLGILWEIHEWALWKYFLKKKIYKQSKDDTINDLFLDFFGAVLGMFLKRLNI